MIRCHTLLPGQVPQSTEGLGAALVSPPSGVVWVDLVAPTRDELALIGSTWAFHPLALEDCVNPQRRAKYERYADFGFIVALALEKSTEELLDTVAVRIFVRGPLVITVHPKPIDPIDRVERHVYDRGRPMGCATERIIHAVLDAIIDEYNPLLDAYEETLDEMERTVAGNPSAELLERLIDIRRDLILMRRMFLPHEEVVRRLMDSPETSDENRLYYRDVLDHLMVVGDTVALLLETANGAIAIHTNAANDRLNRVMKYLAVISTLMLPMTVISGIFGMNFDVIPITHQVYGFWTAIGMMTLSATVLLLWFRVKRWF